MKKMTRAALAASLLLGLVITTAPSYAGTLNKKQAPKITASNQAIKVSGAKPTVKTTRTVKAPMAKKPKSGK